MNEGGQSSTGQLIDFMITTHHAYPKLVERAEKEGTNIHKGTSVRHKTRYLFLGFNICCAVLADVLNELKAEANVETLTELTKDMHLYPDLHGQLAVIFMRSTVTNTPVCSWLQAIVHPSPIRACEVR